MPLQRSTLLPGCYFAKISGFARLRPRGTQRNPETSHGKQRKSRYFAGGGKAACDFNTHRDQVSHITKVCVNAVPTGDIIPCCYELTCYQL